MKVEVAGVCGTDVSQYKLPLRGAPLIMGHENVGYLAKVGTRVRAAQGIQGGRPRLPRALPPVRPLRVGPHGRVPPLRGHRVVLRPEGHPLRLHLASTPRPRSGAASATIVYLPLNAVLHKVPDGLSPEEAGIATPMSNGIQWTLMDGGVGYASTVLIQGPGQQGLCCAMAAKQAGADRIIVTGTSKDARRLEVAKALGADAVIDVQKEDALARILEITERARRRRRHRLHAAARARRRCCSASKRPSAGAGRWSCRARATPRSPTFRSAGSRARA